MIQFSNQNLPRKSRFFSRGIYLTPGDLDKAAQAIGDVIEDEPLKVRPVVLSAELSKELTKIQNRHEERQ